MKKRPTIIDVARAAGVSKSTVSLVLQNSPAVKQKTRELVNKAIGETRYVYNRAAANLRGAGTGLIGLVINDLRNPYYTELAVTVQMAFTRHGYATVIANSDENTVIQQQVVSSMIEHGVSGLMIAPCYGDEKSIFEDLRLASIPTLQVLRQVDPRCDLFPFYSMDYETGSYIAAEHLVARGARRIAFIGGIEDRVISQERKSGYLQLMSELGREAIVIHGTAERAFGYVTALDIARTRPDLDAAITFNDQVALGMLAGFAEAGVAVGKEFFIIGFDDIQEASQSYPKLSSVRCDVNKLGTETAKILLDWIESDIHPVKSVRYPVELITRASG